MGNNIIELNGKRYDAKTGTFLGVSKKLPPSVTPLPKGPKVIDGFVRASRSSAPPALQPKPRPAPVTVPPPKKLVLDISAQKPRKAGKDLQPRQPQKPQTLMRHVVKKPVAPQKSAIKIQPPTELAARPKHSLSRLEKKLAVERVDQSRLARANQVPKSQKIQRFEATRGQKANSSALSQTAKPPTISVQRPATTRPVSRAAIVVPAARPSVTRPVTHSNMDVFEAALARANSHTQPHVQPKKRSNKLVILGIMVGICFLAAGGLAFANRSTIEVRLASMRAGFVAKVPSYHITGYSVSGIESDKGKVAVNFVSGDSAYKVTEELSSWNSQTLLDNFISDAGNRYKTIDRGNRIVYVYGTNQAAWINSGVRYTITGNAQLSENELVSLATSM